LKLYKRNLEIKTQDGKTIKRNVYKQVTETADLGFGLLMDTIRLVARYNNELWEVKGILGVKENMEPKLMKKVKEES